MSADSDDSLRCPLCEYDLRGLTEPRCPECGYAFTWDELRDPARRLHPYLFEHHPERNLWSLRRTFLGGMLPRRFWRQLLPTQPSHPRRLMAYAILSTFIALFPWLVYYVIAVYNMDAANRGQRAGPVRYSPQHAAQILSEYRSLRAYQDRHLPVFPNPRLFWKVFHSYGYRATLLIALVIVTWPWLTLAALVIFQASMRRAKVKAVHVLRCVIYSSSALIAVPLALWAWHAYEMIARPAAPPGSITEIVVFILLAVFGVMIDRLWVAYRMYLRFPHALGVALASQVMVGLLVWKFALDWL